MKISLKPRITWLPRSVREDLLDEFDQALKKILAADISSFRQQAHTWAARILKLV